MTAVTGITSPAVKPLGKTPARRVARTNRLDVTASAIEDGHTRKIEMKASVPILISMMLAIGGVLIAPVSVTPQGLNTPEATTTQDYDYRSLAVASILTSAQEASKLPNIEDQVSLVIAAVKLLPASHRDKAISLIKSCLQDLQELKPETTNSGIGRFTLNRLHNELLAVYAQLDPERALAAANQDVQEEIALGDRNKFLRAGGKWSSEILARRAPADQKANLAISIVHTNPDQAFALVIQSVKDGIVSSSINALCEKLKQNPNRDFLDRLQLAIAESLASTTTMDSFSWGYAVGLLDDDRMNYKAKRGLIRFLMNSLKTWAALVKGDDGNGGLDSSYVSSSFTRLVLNVRPAIAQHSHSDTLRFDIILKQASAVVPEKTRTTLQVFQPENLTDPRERLNAILKESNTERRDLRLIGLASELLRSMDTSESAAQVELAVDTVKEFTDSQLRASFGDLSLIKRADSLVKVKKFVEAKNLVTSISSDETRIWTMLALAEAASQDTVLTFEFLSDALKALETMSPSPAKVALTLMATALMAEDNPQRSFETLATAAKYAKSSKDFVEQQAGLVNAMRLEASIGKLSLIPGSEPKSLAEVRIDPRVALLARSDWFRAQYLANSFPESALRLMLKLQFAGSVLSDSAKQTKSSPKRPSKG